MIGSWEEIDSRFDAIKDHKPKASKKLNELGDILASAYKLDADRADEMWQYIVDLNVADNVANSKFYIAQVFNKLRDRLTPEEATELITMTPDRVQLMVLYGYDGNTLWRCLDTLIRGYLNMGNSDNAAVCIEYFYDKFGGINSGNVEIMNVVKNAVNICFEMIKSGVALYEAKELLCIIENSANEDVNLFVQLIKVLNGSEEINDYDSLFDIAKEYKCPIEFFDLLWIAKERYTQEELRDKWIEYLESCDENDIRPYNYLYEDADTYEYSKLKFYVDIEKDAEELLNYYFNRTRIYDVEKGIIRAWIEEEKWDSFTKYISMLVMASQNDSLDWLVIKGELNIYMKASFFHEWIDSTDRYGRSLKLLMKLRSKAFAEALSKVSMITVGCDCHDSFHELVKEYVQKLNGNLDLLNELGFSDEIETRTAEERLKEYIHEFLMTGELEHEQKSTKYSLIIDALREKLYDEKRDDAEDKDAVDEDLEQAYRLALDDEIVEFYFAHCPREYNKRTELLTACVRKNDLARAIELIDIMASTKGNPGYEELNGWGRQNMLTLKYLIQQFDYNARERRDAEKITNEMREAVRELVYRMLPHLSVKAKEEIEADIYKIDPNKADHEEYISQLLEDADIYITFPKPRGKGGAQNINRMSQEFMNCFEHLSNMGRLDVVAQIMLKFASVKDILKPVPFSRWMTFMSNGLKEGDLKIVYRNNPEIFEEWITIKNLTDWDIIRVAEKLGKASTRSEFMTFRNMVIDHKGMVNGLDRAFKATSENTETQLLFDGAHAKIELDFLEFDPYNLNSVVTFHLLTTKKTGELSSVRILSCKINSIETDNIGSYSDFSDNGPDSGYLVWDKESAYEIRVYSDFFGDIVNQIELQLVLMNDNAEVIENVPDIIIKYDPFSGEYLVIKQTENK